jgi:hypothetical protein
MKVRNFLDEFGSTCEIAAEEKEFVNLKTD